MNCSSITIALLVAMMSVRAASAATNNPFFGLWKIVNSSQAPWYDGNAAPPTIDPELDGKTITFSANQAKGSRIVECAKPVYQLSTDTPE